MRHLGAGLLTQAVDVEIAAFGESIQPGEAEGAKIEEEQGSLLDGLQQRNGMDWTLLSHTESRKQRAFH